MGKYQDLEKNGENAIGFLHALKPKYGFILLKYLYTI
jgi:hypothetical protein